MISSLKQKLCAVVLGLLIILGWVFYFPNTTDAAPLQYKRDFSSQLKGFVIKSSDYWVDSEDTFRNNIFHLFYPNKMGSSSAIYEIIKWVTLWVMVIFIVMAWASLLMNKKPDESKKHLTSLLYVLLGWVFVYAANRLFWDVLNFWRSGDMFTEWEGVWWFKNALVWEGSVLFVILSAVKAFAFFLAIIMIVITWFKVMAAWEWEKWKKLVKWIINVVVALLIIKWVDFIYYLAADSENFVGRASDFIIDVAKIFGYIYGVIIVIMVIVSWYLYITDWWDWSNFKKASNVLINILLSALVLFAFLLITYQIFAEFQTWGDAVTTLEETPVSDNPVEPTAFLKVDKNYI